MLGRHIEDGVESEEAEAVGLGLLPIEAFFEEEKILGRPQGRALSFGDAEVSGYEIHHGRVRRDGGEPLFDTGDDTEGCLTGSTLGTSWHGVLESDGFRRALLLWVARERGRDWRPGEASFAAAREVQLEKLGDLVADYVDREALMKLIDDGLPSGLPVVRLQASGIRLQQGREGETAGVQGASGSNGDGSLIGATEPARSPAATPENLKAET